MSLGLFNTPSRVHKQSTEKIKPEGEIEKKKKGSTRHHSIHSSHRLFAFLLTTQDAKNEMVDNTTTTPHQDAFNRLFHIIHNILNQLRAHPAR